MTNLAVLLTALIIGSGAYMTEHWIILAASTFVIGVTVSEGFCNIKHDNLDPR